MHKKDRNLLIEKYFEEHSVVESNINSFNNFISNKIHKIIENMGEIIPTIIPPDVNDFKIKFEKIRISKPQIIEADGSRRDIFPNEARLRKLTYSAPIEIDVSTYADGVQRESFTTQIGKIPVMLKSKLCHLNKLSREELIKRGEDPDDPGGYFILNGNERVMIIVEDLAPNTLFIQKNKIGPVEYSAKLFSSYGYYRIPHTIEQTKDGIISISFTRLKKIPIIAVIKSLGLTSDKDILELVSENGKYNDELFRNIYEVMDIKNETDAYEYLSKKAKIMIINENDFSRIQDTLDNYLFPHLGTNPKDRIWKAYNLCKLLKRFLMTSKDKYRPTDKDHYMHKQLQLSGDLLADLFMVNLRILINDIIYNFQRLVKRGKFQSVKIIIREKLLTSRMMSAMATGSWVGGRKGVSQNIDRSNYLSSISHLQRVVSLLSTSQENFEARELHPTHWGRLCAIETPEGTPIGLRKNLALLSQISQEPTNNEKLRKTIESYGVNQP